MTSIHNDTRWTMIETVLRDGSIRKGKFRYLTRGRGDNQLTFIEVQSFDFKIKQTVRSLGNGDQTGFAEMILSRI